MSTTGGGEIHIKGARQHNLKNVEVILPRNQLVVVTGVSGSGKSSLVFDTLYAEGHRRYVESLSSYARQFLARLQKPEVDFIHGLSPAIAIEQRVSTSNPRSTVGSTTEILDYLRLLYARIGRTISPVSGQEVIRHTVTDVVNHLTSQPPGTRMYLLADIPQSDRDLKQELEIALQKGFLRVWDGVSSREVEEILQGTSPFVTPRLTLVIDRFVASDGEVDEDFLHRMADSVQTAFNEGHGDCLVVAQGLGVTRFSERFELDGLTFEVPSVQLFNFNNSYGACPTCEGFGRVMGIDESLVVPDPTLSVFDGAVSPWRGAMLSAYQQRFMQQAVVHDFPIHRSYNQLTKKEKDLLWHGRPDVEGIDHFFEEVRRQSHKVQYRVLAARYRGYTTCPECAGSRLRKEASYVQIDGWPITRLMGMSVKELAQIFPTLQLTEHERQVADRLYAEITTRLQYLLDVGLGYLHLDRKMSTLSGGETQRINLATSLGSNLTGSLYILDEPSIGLHPRDGERLIKILKHLRRLGNSVIVVEHDEALMRAADVLLDMGPLAGELGGEVVAIGAPEALTAHPESLTARYLRADLDVPAPTHRRTPTGWLKLRGASEHNLQQVDADFPLGTFTVVTGVSGSGKSTLVRQILYPLLLRHIGGHGERPGAYADFLGDTDRVKHVELVDQSAIGKNVRSNPVTYVGAYDAIRELFASQPAAKDRGLRALHFSFNVQGGRCETCQGEGFTTVEMQFLPDIKLLCETCQGKRFKDLVLEVTYEDRSIYDVLQMTVHEALDFFRDAKKVVQRLQKLADVGLGYVRLGQSTSTLSGGEAQRLKLASFLDRKEDGGTVYFFDEPTTGLHFHDVALLMQVFYRLVEQGNTVIVIEHNLDVIKCADWLIDLGPEGGDAGGQLLYAGTPEGLLGVEGSYTAQYLAPKLAKQPARQ